ncbi:hypothetical protein [Dyadobacter sp. 3J3]|uniref:hypothetical protein n=1 Tax=Dyadobacter sp. 3J3 TaxID=2606600 RepID=UPI0013572083|nr:hypothetical protein [Dyadobacter sp. 3J3]
MFKSDRLLELGLKETLKELCDFKVFFKGFNLKCKKCSSIFWYHIKDVSETVECRGCLEEFEIPIEPKFFYKLNDLIKNNIYQSKTDRDGNLTVIRTLALKSKLSHKAFAYSPQINLFDNYHTNKPITDIDILYLTNGKLAIGEAKHSSPAFFEKNSSGFNSVDTIAEIAKEIRPDIIILSCYSDHNDKLEKARKTLTGKFHNEAYKPIIETLLLKSPDDWGFKGHRYFYY